MKKLDVARIAFAMVLILEGVCGAADRKPARAKATGAIMTPKAVVPGPDELEMNPRAASAKMRALRKL